MPPKTERIRPLRAAAALAVLGPLVAGCAESVLDPVGPVGRADAEILIDATLIMLGIIIPTILLAFWMAWRYRASNPKAEYLPNWSYSGRIEAVVWSIPILTIMFIGGVIWIGSYQLDPFKPLPAKPGVRPLEVQVVSLDWKWLFIYPEQGVATVNQLVVPAGRPVHFSITSGSVFNAFFVHRMGSMIYAMPGMVSQLNLQADQPATVTEARGRFALVEGTVLSVRESRGVIYLNFGRRWTRDFTAIVLKRNQRLFAAAGMTLTALEGRRIRVRGFIEQRSGPIIEAATPDQIERADTTTAARP